MMSQPQTGGWGVWVVFVFLSNGVTTPDRWLGSVGGLCVSVK